MKIFANEDRAFINKLAKKVADTPKVKIVKPELPKDEPSSTEEATDHAKAYWMMGWTWDEIEVILEELEFDEKTISKAIKNAQEYAKDMLKDGPFNIFKDGQKIILTNGAVGTLKRRYANHIVLKSENTDVNVDADKIDLDKSKKLAEAYAMRCSARKIYKQADDELIKLDDKTVKMPGAPQKRPLVSPDPEERWDTKITERAPAGWGPMTPKMSEIEEITPLAEAALTDLDNLMIDYSKVQEENKTLLEMSRDIKKRMKDLEKQQAELAKNIFGIVATQDQALDDLDVTVFNKYKNKIVGLQRKVEASEFPPTFEEELTAVKEFLEVNHPKIASDVKQVIDQWSKQNTQLKEVIKNTFAYYTPEKKKMGQVFSKVFEWVSNLWSSVKSLTDKVNTFVLPEVEHGIVLMDRLDAALGKSVTSHKVHAALRVRLK